MANSKVKRQVSEFKKDQVNKNSIRLLKQKPNNYSSFFLPFIIIITAIVFINTLGNDFTDNWDDNGYILNNEIIKHFDWKNLQKIFSTFYKGNYHPLTILTYTIEFKLFGLNPFHFHLTNLILHLFNTILVYLFLNRFTRKPWVAAISSLFFAVHPMHVESVAWISERKDVLYTFFFLLSLNCYGKYLITEKKISYMVWSFFWFFLSLMSKPAAVCLPLVLVLMDFYHHKKLSWGTFISKIPFFALAILFGILAVFSQKNAESIRDIAPLFSIFDRFFLVSYSTVYYLFEVFTPLNLSAIHYYPVKSSGGLLPLEYYLALPVLLLIIYGVFKSGRFKYELIFGLLFYFTTIVMVLQILPVGQAIVSERYSYVPYIGIFFIFGQFFSYVKDKEFSFNSKIKYVISFILIVLTVLYSFLTYERNKIWENAIVLFTDVIKKYPEQGHAYVCRGLVKDNTGDFYGAIADYSRAIELNPKYIEAYFNRGTVYFKIDKYENSVSDYNKGLELSPNDPMAYYGRGFAKTKLNDFNGAIADYNKVLELKPDGQNVYPDIYLNRAVAKDGLKDYTGALSDNNKVLQYKPNDPCALFNRGIAKLNLNDKKGACYDWLLAQQYGHPQAAAALEMYCK